MSLRRSSLATAGWPPASLEASSCCETVRALRSSCSVKAVFNAAALSSIRALRAGGRRLVSLLKDWCPAIGHNIDIPSMEQRQDLDAEITALIHRIKCGEYYCQC